MDVLYVFIIRLLLLLVFTYNSPVSLEPSNQDNIEENPFKSGYYSKEREQQGLDEISFEYSRWKYYIPHEWSDPTRRKTWEDIYLMPDEPSYNGLSIWLEVEAIKRDLQWVRSESEKILARTNNKR